MIEIKSPIFNKPIKKRSVFKQGMTKRLKKTGLIQMVANLL